MEVLNTRKGGLALLPVTERFIENGEIHHQAKENIAKTTDILQNIAHIANKQMVMMNQTQAIAASAQLASNHHHN